MKRLSVKNFFDHIYLMVLLLPFLGGCETGITSLTSLFGTSTGLSSFLGLSGGSGEDIEGSLGLFSFAGGDSLRQAFSEGGDAAVASFHNPEPTTMILVGSGMLAMSYFGKKVIKK